MVAITEIYRTLQSAAERHHTLALELPHSLHTSSSFKKCTHPYCLEYVNVLAAYETNLVEWLIDGEEKFVEALSNSSYREDFPEQIEQYKIDGGKMIRALFREALM